MGKHAARLGPALARLGPALAHCAITDLESGRGAAVLGGDADQGDIRACMREGGEEGVEGEANLCTDSQDYEPQPPGNRARRMRSP